MELTPPLQHRRNPAKQLKEKKMTYKLKSALLGVATMIALSNVAPAAKADDWTKETVVTFSAPFQVPGKDLPAGTYVFKIANAGLDRYLVQIFTEDQQHLMATVIAVPNSRPDPASRTIVTLDDRPAGRPEAIKSWFYPGETDGVKFVYSK
jgi:hypothetical protein